MRILFMIFTIAERNFKILQLPVTTTTLAAATSTLLQRRHSHQNSFDYDLPSLEQVDLSREATRLVIRRLQRTVLRILRDPDAQSLASAESGLARLGSSIGHSIGNRGSTSLGLGLGFGLGLQNGVMSEPATNPLIGRPADPSRPSADPQTDPQQPNQNPPPPSPASRAAEDQAAGSDESAFAAHRRATAGAGKQDSNCRTCNDFKSWSKQQRLISSVHSAKAKHMAATDKINVSAVAEDTQREDCPLDKVRLGISTWGLLHTMAAFYSDNPTDVEKRDMKTFFEVLSRLYPCEFCAKDFRTDLDVNPINVNSQKELALWLCKFHNRVNDKLGKPLFDCSKVNERWRDGWLDGSCD